MKYRIPAVVLLCGAVSLSVAAYAQTAPASAPAAPLTHGQKKAVKAQQKADKEASIAQAKADKKQTKAQGKANNEKADATVDATKKQ